MFGLGETEKSEKKFVKVFEFCPAGRRELREAKQKEVERLLSQKAVLYNYAGKRQEELAGIAKKTEMKDFRLMAATLKDAEINVKNRKEDFWAAHGLAKYFGYKVLDTSGAYLLPNRMNP